jgi:hypothetical protein
MDEYHARASLAKTAQKGNARNDGSGQFGFRTSKSRL